MRLRFPIGTSDFAQIRRAGDYYVDKTGLIADVIRGSSLVSLIPRPRRFGKTLNLSTLRYYFERPVGPTARGRPTPEDIRGFFDGLEVATAGEDVAERFMRHPVVYLTFKDVKFRRWEDCLAMVVALVREEVERLSVVWAGAELAPGQRATLEAVAAGTGTPAELAAGLRLLTHALHSATGEECVLLIDEYDTPIHEGWQYGYYDQVIELFRGILSGTIKDNASLYRGVLTGILRVAKESLFSGLNNVGVYSLLAHPFSTRFGFTEEEVVAMCAAVGPSADLQGIRDWYNGYRMGGHVIYNPWSVLCYLASPIDGLKPHWVNTASNALLQDLLIRAGLEIQSDLETLIKGGEVLHEIGEDIHLRNLHADGAIWSFLLFCGYLKAEDVRHVKGRTFAALSVPNFEVGAAYAAIYREWLTGALRTPGGVDGLCRALLTGDERTFGAGLQRLVLESLSYFDTGARTPEAVYQAFLVGLLVQLNHTHVVDSNRESGFGRYDVCVKPRADFEDRARLGRGGAVLELKSIDTEAEPPEDTQTALASAMKQIKDREYATALHQAGVEVVWLWAVVFDGKRVRAKVERA